MFPLSLYDADDPSASLLFHTPVYLEPNTEYSIECLCVQLDDAPDVWYLPFSVGMESKTVISVKGVQFSFGPASFFMMGGMDGFDELDASKCSLVRGLIFSF